MFGIPLRLVVLSAVMAMTACYPIVDGNKSCELEWKPRGGVILTGTGRTIIGQAVVSCKIPPQRHELTITLRYRTHGTGWTIEAEAASRVIPRRRPPTVYQVTAPCAPGRWQAHVHVTGSLQGMEFEFSDRSIEKVVFPRERR